MFNFNDSPHAAALDKTIAEILVKLDTLQGDTNEYTAATANLVKLMEIKNQMLKTGNDAAKIENDYSKIQNDHFADREKIDTEKEKIRIDEARFDAEQEEKRSWKPSPDAVVTAAASVVGILLVLHYEKLGVVTSKALSFIGKAK
jgi:hypothetical protein